MRVSIWRSGSPRQYAPATDSSLNALMRLVDGACGPRQRSVKPLPEPGLSAAKLTTTARSDGAPQVLYNGHPLYRYAGDAKPGDTNGQRVTAFGAAWFAVSGAGQVVSRPASKPGGGSRY